MEPSWLIALFQALLTPVIGAVAVYIAFQQWKTNRQKLLWDRYDRRLKVYEEVTRILRIIQRDAVASTDDLLKFRTAVSEADFLFGPEIREHIDRIYRCGLELHHWRNQYRAGNEETPTGYDHQKVVQGMSTELDWLTNQLEPTKEKFRKYLDVSA